MGYTLEQTSTRYLYVQVQVASRQIVARGLVLAVDGESVLTRIDIHFHSRYRTLKYLPCIGFLLCRVQRSLSQQLSFVFPVCGLGCNVGSAALLRHCCSPGSAQYQSPAQTSVLLTQPVGFIQQRSPLGTSHSGDFRENTHLQDAAANFTTTIAFKARRKTLMTHTMLQANYRCFARQHGVMFLRAAQPFQRPTASTCAHACKF